MKHTAQDDEGVGSLPVLHMHAVVEGRKLGLPTDEEEGVAALEEQLLRTLRRLRALERDLKGTAHL